jgi:hypothetical protein
MRRGRGAAGGVRPVLRVTALMVFGLCVGVGASAAWAGDPLQPDPVGPGGTILHPDPSPIGARSVPSRPRAPAASSHAAAPASTARVAARARVATSRPLEGRAVAPARRQPSTARRAAARKPDTNARRSGSALTSIARGWLSPSVARSARAAPALAAPSTPTKFPLVAAALALVAVVLASGALLALTARVSLRPRT